MDALPEWIASLVGQENFDQMLEDGMTWNQMNDLLVYLLESYGLNASAGETVAEVEDEEGSRSPKISWTYQDILELWGPLESDFLRFYQIEEPLNVRWNKFLRLVAYLPQDTSTFFRILSQ